MSDETIPVLRRSHSSSVRCTIDPYNQAEQGFQLDSTNVTGARQPPEAKRTLSSRYSLRSSDSTVVDSGGHFELTDRSGVNQLPCQDLPRRSTTWSERCVNIMQWLSVSQPSQQQSPTNPLDEFQDGYSRFQYECFDNYPDGWPRVAAFLESSDSFGNYRKFGHCHARLLIDQMSTITEMEQELLELDRKDAAGGEATDWRLKNRNHKKGPDTKKRDLQENMKKELLTYVPLLLNYQKLKSLDQTPARDHDSVFKWLWTWKPLDTPEFAWIFHPQDFVSLVPPRQSGLENFILRYLDNWPRSYLKNLFKSNTQQHQTQDASVAFYSASRINTFARLMVVFFAVLVLFIPVILFLLTSMSRACMAVVVLAFCFIFSVMMGLLTHAADKEIFVGVATYCAVLVTFLGNLTRAKA
ncbi:hypothetical protein F5882DRAFT_40412 [Hyaloscypha sp. PMI_1271]|nr:hypothetical protein F5882DRAFT_40412 [Hyaloscypha sp. PMI_1271]